jgi:hypothetical protein
MSISSLSEHTLLSSAANCETPAKDQSIKAKRSHKVNPKYQEFFKGFEFGRNDAKSPAALKTYKSVQQHSAQSIETRVF